MSNLSLTVNPAEFFRDHVTSAINNQKLTISDEVEFYIVNLLCEFICQTKIKTSTEEIDLLDTPIAILLKKALDARPEEQVKMFKAVGDTTLYISGYFQDYFNDKTFTIDYFIGVGANAYNSVSSLSRELYKDKTGAEIYNSLAENFKKIVEIVAEVSDNLGMTKSQNILAIYDRWIRNQSSDRLRRKLEGSGIIPIPINIKSSH